MKQYFVEFRRTSYVHTWVDAENEQQAEEIARQQLETDEKTAAFELEYVEEQQ